MEATRTHRGGFRGGGKCKPASAKRPGNTKAAHTWGTRGNRVDQVQGRRVKQYDAHGGEHGYGARSGFNTHDGSMALQSSGQLLPHLQRLQPHDGLRTRQRGKSEKWPSLLMPIGNRSPIGISLAFRRSKNAKAAHGFAGGVHLTHALQVVQTPELESRRVDQRQESWHIGTILIVG